MATVTLQAIVDEIREHPIGRGVRDMYMTIKPGDRGHYQSAYRDAAMGQIKPTQSCAVGEAVLQLGRMAQECVIDMGNDGSSLFEALGKCVEGTSIEFWERVEDWYSFGGHPRSVMGFQRGSVVYDSKITRVQAIKKAAKEFGIKVK